MKFSAFKLLVFVTNLLQLSKAGPTQNLNGNSTENQMESEAQRSGINWEEINNSQRDELQTPMEMNEVVHPSWFHFGKWNSAEKTSVVLSRSKRDLSFALQRVLGPQFLSLHCSHKSFNQCTKYAPTKLYLYPLEGSLSTFIIHDGSTAIGAISKSASLQYTQTSDLEYVYNNPRYHWTAQTENGFSKFINVASGLALDGNGVGDVYLHESIKGNNYQNWKLREWSSNIIDLGPDANWEVPTAEGYRLQSTVTKGFVSLRCNQGTKKACAVPQFSAPLPIRFTPVNADYSDDQRGTSVYIHDVNKDDDTKYAIGVSAIRNNGSGREKIQVEDVRMIYEDKLYHWLVVAEQGENRRFVNIATGYILTIQATEPSIIATSERTGNSPVVLIKL